MANDRLERYSKIRRWLNHPYSQRPSADQILNQMLTEEQNLNLELTNSRQPWALLTKTITTVADQSTYEIEQPVSGNQNSGKVHFVVRTTGDTYTPSLPVEFDDFSGMDYGIMPPSGEVNSRLIVPEKISFYRTNQQNQTINAVIQPVPQEVLTYTVWFFSGSLDRAHALMTGTAAVSELVDYLDLKTALFLLPYAVWSDEPEMNRNERESLSKGLAAQVANLKPVVDKYIRNINSPETFEMGYWND